MITVRIGNIFDSDAQTVVNTVNCVGVMGKGIALEFKKRFPDMYSDYVQRCKRHEVQLGRPYLYRRLTPPWILNFPTKDHWRSVSRLDDIVAGLVFLERQCREWGIASLAVPPLGCGHGHLEWRVVGPTLYRHLQQLGVPVELFAPFDTCNEELQTAFLVQKAEDSDAPRPQKSYRIPPAQVALVEILRRIECEPYHRPVGRTTFQKIAYFATESGIPTGLGYVRGSFGPYASDLKRHVAAMVNNGVIREERLGRMFAVRTGPTFPDARIAYTKEVDAWHATIEKVVDLFLRMDTKQAEIAATIHFAAKELQSGAKRDPEESEILDAVLAWKQRRRPPLDSSEVSVSIRHLNILGWIRARVSDDLPVPDGDPLNV